jgi:hypothetical protein
MNTPKKINAVAEQIPHHIGGSENVSQQPFIVKPKPAQVGTAKPASTPKGGAKKSP